MAASPLTARTAPGPNPACHNCGSLGGAELPPPRPVCGEHVGVPQTDFAGKAHDKGKLRHEGRMHAGVHLAST